MDTKSLINRLSITLNRDSEDIVVLLDSLSNIIVDQVKEGNSVAIPGFGSFEPKLRAEREVVHPSAGKRMLVPPKMLFVFKPSTLLKQKVRNS